VEVQVVSEVLKGISPVHEFIALHAPQLDEHSSAMAIQLE